MNFSYTAFVRQLMTAFYDAAMLNENATRPNATAFGKLNTDTYIASQLLAEWDEAATTVS